MKDETKFMPKHLALIIMVFLVIGLIFLIYLYITQLIVTLTPVKKPSPTHSSNETISETINACAKYNISPDTMIFIYLDTCPRCVDMKPIIKKLEGEGYVFYWVEIRNDMEGREMVSACFGDILGTHVPQFICAGNKATHIGEMTTKQLKEFAEKCKQR